MPVSCRLRFPVDPFEQVTRWKFFDAVDHRIRSGYIVEVQKTIQCIDIDSPAHCRVFQKSFDFRSEKDVGSGPMKKERFDTHAIACQDQPFLRLGPNGKSEHSSKAAETFDVPLAKCMKHDFGVALMSVDEEMRLTARDGDRLAGSE